MSAPGGGEMLFESGALLYLPPHTTTFAAHFELARFVVFPAICVQQLPRSPTVDESVAEPHAVNDKAE